MDFDFRVRGLREAFRYKAMRFAVLNNVFGRRWTQEPLGDVMRGAK